MTSSSGGETMTHSEVTAFAQKVETWAQGLSPKEQEFLAEMIARAATTDPGDVRGYMYDAFLKIEGIPGESAGNPQPNAAQFLKIAPLSSSFLKIHG